MPDFMHKLSNVPLPRARDKQIADVPQSAGVDFARLRRLETEYDRRRIETLKCLTLTDKQWEALKHAARKRLFLGANRTGKTSLLAIDIGLLVTGTHPTRQYPDGYEGKIYCVGKDTNSLAKVFYKKLFMRGAFWIIQDKETGAWRSFHPDTDAHREKDKRQAPPIVPRRLVKEEAFRIKKTKVPKTVIIKNDRGQTWEIDFFTGNAEPQRGVDLDAGYFSEEIEDSEWYSEMMARILDRHGYFVWDAAQQDGSDALSELDDEAERQLENPNPDVWKVRFSLYDNPYMPRSEIEFLEKSLHSQEERDIRIHGLSAVRKIRMFHEFSTERHEFLREWLPKESVPLDWCRYMALDPGIECACALFAAVPPPSFKFHPNLILLYDEIYISGQTIPQMAKLIADRLVGQSMWLFLIDEAQGRKRSSSTGRTEKEQYIDEFIRLRCRSEQSGFGFWPGFSDRQAGVQMVRTALGPTPETGRPRLMFLEGTCQNFVNEMRMLKRDKVKNKYGTYEYMDVPAARQPDHAFDTLRYIVGQNPQWHKPKSPRIAGSWIQDEVERYHRAKRSRRSCVVLGPNRKERTHG